MIYESTQIHDRPSDAGGQYTNSTNYNKKTIKRIKIQINNKTIKDFKNVGKENIKKYTNLTFICSKFSIIKNVFIHRSQ